MANYTQGYCAVFKTAERIKAKFNLTYIGTELVLYAILSTPKCDACSYLNKFGVTRENYFAPLKRTLKERNVSGYTVKCLGAQKTAVEISRSLKLSYISTEHLLLAILTIEDSRAMSILRSLGVDIPSLYAYVYEINKVKSKNIVEPEKIFEEENKQQVSKATQPIQNVNFTQPQKQVQPAPKTTEKPQENPLEAFGYSLTERAENGVIDPVIGRDEEIF